MPKFDNPYAPVRKFAIDEQKRDADGKFGAGSAGHHNAEAARHGAEANKHLDQLKKSPPKKMPDVDGAPVAMHNDPATIRAMAEKHAEARKAHWDAALKAGTPHYPKAAATATKASKAAGR